AFIYPNSRAGISCRETVWAGIAAAVGRLLPEHEPLAAYFHGVKAAKKAHAEKRCAKTITLGDGGAHITQRDPSDGDAIKHHARGINGPVRRLIRRVVGERLRVNAEAARIGCGKGYIARAGI